MTGQSGWQLVDEIPVHLSGQHVYAEGWQSWSPTTWYSTTQPAHRPDEAWQHTMRFRPGMPLPVQGWQGEGLLVVDPGAGAPARSYCVADATEEVPSIWAKPLGDRLEIWATGPVLTAASGVDGVAALAAAGTEFAQRAGVRALTPAPRVWCSWYRYFEDVTADDLLENLAAFDTFDVSVDVVQIDDGWSHGLGEWNRLSDGFPSLAGLIDTIRGTGRRAGIWLAPFLVGEDTAVARQHPEWLLGDAGRNWGQQLRGLDLTHPGVQDYLRDTILELRGLGVDYFKLDFLYAGAIPGERSTEVSPIAAYRSGVELIRAAAGPDALLLGCGAPILPSVGLFDAMRVSPDTFHEGGEDGSTGLRGRLSLTARAWQHGRFWITDPDCLVVRPTYGLREDWAHTVTEFGGMHSVSDRIADLDAWGLDTTRRLLSEVPSAEPFADDVLRRAALVSGSEH